MKVTKLDNIFKSSSDNRNIILFGLLRSCAIYSRKNTLIGIDLIDSLSLNFYMRYKNSKNINYKILVSGTGMGFTKSSLKKNLGPNFNPQLIQCCIDLDDVSKNTITNARETFKWTSKNDIKEFILIMKRIVHGVMHYISKSNFLQTVKNTF